MTKTNPPDKTDPQRQINRALGLFLLCFGLIVLMAVLFTETAIGKITNVVAGLIFSLIGLLMIGKRKSKTASSSTDICR